MAETCKNCAQTITENFCANCGQKKYKRIDRKYILDEIQYTFLHANKGFFYSVKNILKNPGKTAREFIDGNRVNHYKPILLVFVLSGISTFVSYKFLGMDEIMTSDSANRYSKTKMNGDMATLMKNYMPFFMILMIPFFALTTKIAFRKWGHNYYEHVVMNAFILTFYTLFSLLIISPIFFLVKDQQMIYMSLIFISYFLIIPILFWFFKEFYKDRETKAIAFRILGIFGLVFLGFILIFIFMFIIGIIISLIFGPEVMQQYLKPA